MIEKRRSSLKGAPPPPPPSKPRYGWMILGVIIGFTLMLVYRSVTDARHQPTTNAPPINSPAP